MQKLSQRPECNFNEKYHAYGSMLFRISMVFLGCREDAEEAVQEVFCKLLYKAPAFNDDEHEKAWLIKTVENQCRDMLRSVWHKRVVKMEDMERYYEDPYDNEVMIEILKLPPEYKTVIYLHYYEDYPISKISNILQIKESAVKMRLHRARQFLRIELKGECT
jgi:RNA polymerase sigma factor (sigma-70 family)